MKKIVVGLVLSLFISAGAAAGDSSRAARGDVKLGVDIGYSPLSLPFPSTKAATVYMVLNPNWQLGLEYAWTTFGLKAFSFELGAMEEVNYTVKARYFPNTNSFNWIMGYGQRDMTVKLARNFFDLVTNNYSLTTTETKTKFIQLGLGNQWQWDKGYVLAVDWLTVNIPFDAEVTTSAQSFASSESNRARIEKAEDIVAWYPQAWVVEMKVGFAF